MPTRLTSHSSNAVYTRTHIPHHTAHIMSIDSQIDTHMPTCTHKHTRTRTHIYLVLGWLLSACSTVPSLSPSPSWLTCLHYEEKFISPCTKHVTAWPAQKEAWRLILYRVPVKHTWESPPTKQPCYPLATPTCIHWWEGQEKEPKEPRPEDFSLSGQQGVRCSQWKFPWLKPTGVSYSWSG